jgi:hypothetical protein
MRAARLGAVILAAIFALSLPALKADAAPCGVNLGNPGIQTAIASVPTVPQGWLWSRSARSFDPSSNYNPCSPLSAVIITVEQGTGSSPEQAMLFHNGSYVGTGTSKAYAFTSVNPAQTTDDTVALNYKDGRNVCTACPGPITNVRYQWQGDHVAMLDPAPSW